MEQPCLLPDRPAANRPAGSGSARTSANRTLSDGLDHASASAPDLCTITVRPAPIRRLHPTDTAAAARWEDRFQELCDLLVPSAGHADTVQGEVILHCSAE
jgi:hypothetical protein